LNRKEKLIGLVSILIWLAVGVALIFVFESLGLDNFIRYDLYNNDTTSFVEVYIFIVSVLVAIRSWWLLTGYKEDFQIKLIWWYFLLGSSIWVVLVYLISLVHIRPPMVEEIIFIILSVIYVFCVYLHYKSSKTRYGAKSQKIQEEKKLTETNSREKATLKGFKVDMKKADQVMKETTPEQWQESMDQLTAERVAQTRSLMSEITYPPNPPLFRWEDVSNYYMDGGRPAVQVKPSDGSLLGFVSNSRKPPFKWHKISPLELIHDSREISKESFFDVYTDLFNSDE
jgi:hypothetical protein